MVQAVLIREGLLLRGAVVLGGYYHKNDIMFGPALITAHEMQELAGWPRVVVEPRMVWRMEQVDRDLAMSLREGEFLITENDGLPYVNYLHATYVRNAAIRWAYDYTSGRSPLFAGLSEWSKEFLTTDYIAAHKKAIEDEVQKEQERGRYRTLVKYHCLANYHNEVIEKLAASLAEWADHSQIRSMADVARIGSHMPVDLSFFRQLAAWGDSFDESKFLAFLGEKSGQLAEEIRTLENRKIDLQRLFPA